MGMHCSLKDNLEQSKNDGELEDDDETYTIPSFGLVTFVILSTPILLSVSILYSIIQYFEKSKTVLDPYIMVYVSVINLISRT